MPLVGNVLVKWGLGAQALRGPELAPLPEGIWHLVMLLAAAGSILIIAIFCIAVFEIGPSLLRRRANHKTVVSIFLLLIAAAYLSPIILVRDLFDRYTIPAIPFLAAGLIGLTGQLDSSRSFVVFVRYISFGLVGGAALFSIAATHDYLAWNRVRWKMVDELIDNNHLSLSDLDAGFEYHGWYFLRTHQETVAASHFRHGLRYRIRKHSRLS